MQSPLISIICPFKNEERYIAEMVCSVLAQTFIDWELLLIDDHSDDSSWAIANDFDDTRIRVVKNQGKGILPALATGFEASHGKYITRMDADDVMPNYKLSCLLNLHQKEKQIVTGHVQYFGEQTISEGYQKYESWLNELESNQDFHDNVYRECVVASANWLCFKSDLVQVGFPDQISYPEDYDLVLKWHEHDFEFVKSDRVTHLWREHPERTSRNSDVYDQKSFFGIKMQYWLRLEYQKNDRVYLMGVNPKTKFIAIFLTGEGIDFEFLSHNPKQIGQLIGGKKVLDFEQTLIVASNVKLLVGVYPSEKQRSLINAKLLEMGFVFGKTCWYV